MIKEDPPYITRTGFRLNALFEMFEYVGHVTVDLSGIKEGTYTLYCHAEMLQRDVLEWTEEQVVVYLSAKITHDYLRSLYSARAKGAYPPFIQARDFVYRLFISTSYTGPFPGQYTTEALYRSISAHLIYSKYYHPAYTRTLLTIQQFMRHNDAYVSVYRLREFTLNLVDTLRRTRVNTPRTQQELDALIYVLSLFH